MSDFTCVFVHASKAGDAMQWLVDNSTRSGTPWTMERCKDNIAYWNGSGKDRDTWVRIYFIAEEANLAMRFKLTWG